MNLVEELTKIKSKCTDLGTYVKLERLISELSSTPLVSEEESELITNYKNLSPTMQKAIREVMKVWLEDNGKSNK